MESLILEKIEEVEYSCELENTYRGLTRTARKIIKKAIMESGCLDEDVICQNVCDILINKYIGKDGDIRDGVLEYQSKRMGLSTIGDIKKAVSSFMSSAYRLKILLKDI